MMIPLRCHGKAMTNKQHVVAIWSENASSNFLLLFLYSFFGTIFFREDYPDHGPSILSDAWLAFQGPRSLYLGSTWEWKSRNSSPNVSADESSSVLQELLPKASSVYPGIKDWTFTDARAGLRAMPPLTPHGSLPLLGCVNDVLGGNLTCDYWLFGGLGSRGLLYHGWLGKLIAQAMLSSNEELIPCELTSWKKIKQ
jgi:glycine/D-amino acid oxidase-like deaminating enzyme